MVSNHSPMVTLYHGSKSKFAGSLAQCVKNIRSEGSSIAQKNLGLTKLAFSMARSMHPMSAESSTCVENPVLSLRHHPEPRRIGIALQALMHCKRMV
jgi:hypothetical protein